MTKPKIKLTPIQILASGFALIILTGALLLVLPVSSRGGESIPFLNALFTAASATCVTGLVVYDTYSQFTVFGQAVILLLIQVGGLGFMAFAVAVSLASGRRIGLFQRSLLMESIGSLQLGGVVRIMKRILSGTVIIETAGALALFFRFCPMFGAPRGAWFAVFHSVSAFCNAGFDLMGFVSPYASLTPFVSDPLVCITVMGLIISGGLGFTVWNDIAEHRFRFSRYSLHSKIMITMTAILVSAAALLFFIIEENGAFSGMGAGERLLAASFQAVTPRTAGFNTVNMTDLTPAGLALTMLLMLIGAGPGSTAGGIKITTFVVIVLSVVSYVRSRSEIDIYGRRLEEEAQKKAFCSASMYIMLVLTGTFAILLSSGLPLERVLFEAISAIGTVGLSAGITPDLPAVSKAVLIILMYSGRVGSLAVAMALGRRKTACPLKYPEEKITVG